jgi:hypothetical protein
VCDVTVAHAPGSGGGARRGRVNRVSSWTLALLLKSGHVLEHEIRRSGGFFLNKAENLLTP